MEEISKESLICLANHFTALHESECKNTSASFEESCKKCQLRISGKCDCNTQFFLTNSEIENLTGISCQFLRSIKEFRNTEAVSGN